MSREVVIYGRIDGATGRLNDDDYRRLQHQNAVVFYQLPIGDTWPWLTRGMFALPAPWPQGTFRRQVIHFGALFKDDAFDDGAWATWLTKFEAVLRKLYWSAAILHMETDGRPPQTWRWAPTDAAAERMRADYPRPVGEWVRTDPPPNTSTI